ncbi:MAG: hypothetical protein BWY83_00811 [bacterium ADurb.Bin478]|nr:MAG: hypothetical protein BWY83_00811 [bacterium ADurb.Bin478]
MVAVVSCPLTMVNVGAAQSLPTEVLLKASGSAHFQPVDTVPLLAVAVLAGLEVVIEDQFESASPARMAK